MIGKKWIAPAATALLAALLLSTGTVWSPPERYRWDGAAELARAAGRLEAERAGMAVEWNELADALGEVPAGAPFRPERIPPAWEAALSPFTPERFDWEPLEGEEGCRLRVRGGYRQVVALLGAIDRDPDRFVLDELSVGRAGGETVLDARFVWIGGGRE